MFKFLFLVLALLAHSSAQQDQPTSGDFYQIENIINEGDNIEFDLTKKGDSAIDQLPKLHARIENLNDYRVRLRVKNADSKAKIFEAPVKLDLDRNKKPIVNKRLYKVEILEDQGLVQVKRRSNKKTIFSLDLGAMIYAENFIQIQTTLSSSRVYGLGEQMDTHQKHFQNGPKKIQMFNRGKLPKPNNPLYGSHPVYLNSEHDGPTVTAHTVFLLNSNPMEIELSPDNRTTWRLLGNGILDFFVNLGPTPLQAVSQYVSLVGRPPLPTYSALGFHISRWGYKSLKESKEIFQGIVNAGIPIDNSVLDIDYMGKDHNIFQVDNENFAGLKEWVEEQHSKNFKQTLIIDPGVPSDYSESEYPPFYEALKGEFLVKNSDGKLAEGKVWNRNLTAFPDFSNPKSEKFWVDNLVKLNKLVDYDILWIDMNEPELITSLDNCNSLPDYVNHVPAFKSYLNDGTLCYDAQFHLGPHGSIHNLYAYFEAKYTRNALLKLNKRPVIISRSTFAGSGRFTSHWTGDVASNWTDLRISISNILDFNMFGIPFVGADICGFVGNTSEELCARWSSVGAFYPFSRNHNTIQTIHQDPVSMGKLVEDSARFSYNLRYSLLPLLYTEMWESSQDGRPVIRSLAMVWPDDPRTYGIEDQFLWGEKLMILPILEEGVLRKRFYLPPGLWYDYPNNNKLFNYGNADGGYVVIQIPANRIKLAVRGGTILFTHKPGINTYETRKSNITIQVFLDETKKATGNIYLDDGESPINSEHPYSLIRADSSADSLVLTPNQNKFKIESLVDTVRIAGKSLSVSKFIVNDASMSVSIKQLNENTFEVQGLSIDLNRENVIRWS